MKVAIITVNFNGKQNTVELLKSLKRNGLEIKTIVVDNGSSDGSIKEFKEVDVLQTGKNLGYAGGFNKGIEYGQIWGADYFLLINNDCLIKDGNLIEELIKILKNNVGLVSPKIYFAPNFEFQKNYKDADLGKVIWFGGGKFDWDNIGNIHYGLDEVDQGQYDKIEETEIFSGACVLVRKEVFEKVGLFNEKYFLYFEDSEFAKRVKDVGFKIFYNGEVSIYHKVSQSTGIGSEITDYYHTRNRLIFGMEYASSQTKFALLREALWFLIFGRKAQRQGVWDYLFGKIKKVEQPKNIEYPVKLSIGIVNYNTSDLTKKLLESIFRNSIDSMEVIVLDNGDVDPCYEKIKEFLPKIKYIKNKENEGFSKGYNKTIKYSLGQYYLMLNSDIEVLPNSLSEILKWAQHFKGQAVLGGKLVFPDRSDQDSAFHLPTLSGAFSEYFLGKKGSYFMYLPDKSTKVEGLVMACLLIPKTIIYNVGMLDEGTIIFFEDIEYAGRLKKFGVSLYYIPSAEFIHHHGASTKRIGIEKATELLQKSAQHYHGKFYYFMLTLVLRLGQKLGRVKTPISRWTQ